MDPSLSPHLNDPPAGVDVTAELTAPPPDAAQRAPVARTAPVPSAKSVELMNHLDALARDFSPVSRSSDRCIETVQEGSGISAGLQAEELVIRVPPRDQFTSDRPSIGRRIPLTVASFFMAALIGIGATFAWQTHRFSKSPIGVTVEQTGSTPASHMSVQDAALPQSATVTQTAPAPAAPATSPELAQQLGTVVQDLAIVRRTLDQLTAKQEQLAATQEQLAAKQEQLAAKQEQMVKNIARQQPVQNIRHKISPPPLSRAVPIPPPRNPPRDTSPETAAQLSSVPAPESNPRPPLPVPQ
jgi:hypothetical protein